MKLDKNNAKEPLYTVMDIARKYDITRQTVYNWLKRKGKNRLKYHYFERGLQRVLVVKKSDLDNFIKVNMKGGKQWHDRKRKQ